MVSNGSVLMGNGIPCQVVGLGSVRIQMFDGVVRTLRNVRHIPSMQKNLISLGMLEANGHQWSSADGVLQVSTGEKVVLKGKRHRNLYVLEGNVVCDQANVTTSQEELTRLWHFRLGHMSEKGLAILQKKGVLSNLRSSKLGFCEHCVLGKQHRKPFGVGTHTSKEVLEYVHSDVWGPAPTPSHSGRAYYVTFIDDYSRYVWIYFLHNKSDVYATFKEWKAQVENQTGNKVRYL